MAILDMCKENNVENLYLHLFTDGRDVSPYSSYSFIEKVGAAYKDKIGYAADFYVVEIGDGPVKLA